MKTLNDLLVSINELVAWMAAGGEKKAGIPAGSSIGLLAISTPTIILVEKIRADLNEIRSIWNELLASNDSSSTNNTGSRLLNKLKLSDQNIDQMITIIASFQAQLRVFEPLVNRVKEISDKKLVNVLQNLAQASAGAAKFKRDMDAGIYNGDRNAANQNWMQWMQKQSDADYAASYEAILNDELKNCATLLQKLRDIDKVATNYRNLITSADADLEEAVKNQQKAMLTKSETLSKYYNRQVGNEMTSLLAII